MTGKHNPLATNPLWRMVIWPRYVSIPLKTHISDPNVVLFNNVARLSVFFIAALMILSIIDWSEKLTSSDVKISYNAWMDLPATPTTDGTKPAFCDNSEYDYVYDDAWKYENIGCRNYGTDSFVKGPTGDKFKINTMYKNVVYEICDPATNVNSQGVSCGDTQLFQTGTSDYYNTRVEDGLITLQMFTKCNRTNFDSEAPENKFMPYIIHRPDGSVVEPTSAQRVSGMGIKLSVSELMELFQVPGGLGGSSDDVSLSTSTGKPTHRIVGIRLTIKPVVRNSVSHTLFAEGSLFGNYALHLYISWEPNWTRTVMPPAPTKTSGEQQNTDAYGILINIDTVCSYYFRLCYSRSFHFSVFFFFFFFCCSAWSDICFFLFILITISPPQVRHDRHPCVQLCKVCRYAGRLAGVNGSVSFVNACVSFEFYGVVQKWT